MNLDGCSGEKLTNQNHSGEKSTNHNQETRRRSRNPEKLSLPIRSFTLDKDEEYFDHPEKLSLPIRSFTLDKDDEYFDPNSSPGTLTQPNFLTAIPFSSNVIVNL